MSPVVQAATVTRALSFYELFASHVALVTLLRHHVNGLVSVPLSALADIQKIAGAAPYGMVAESAELDALVCSLGATHGTRCQLLLKSCLSRWLRSLLATRPPDDFTIQLGFSHTSVQSRLHELTAHSNVLSSQTHLTIAPRPLKTHLPCVLIAYYGSSSMIRVPIECVLPMATVYM